jgi:hypothetical protein
MVLIFLRLYLKHNTLTHCHAFYNNQTLEPTTKLWALDNFFNFCAKNATLSAGALTVLQKKSCVLQPKSGEISQFHEFCCRFLCLLINI